MGPQIALRRPVGKTCMWGQLFFITDRVRSTREGYVLGRVCPSVCLSTPGGGYPSPGPGGVPQPGPGGYPS